MKKRILLIAVLIIAVLLICGTAAAEGQTNPRMQHVQDTIRQRNAKSGLYLAENAPSLKITCNKVPTLAAPGKFTVTVNNDDGSDWSFEYAVSDTGRDPQGYIYFGPQTNSRIFDGFTFYTPGEYKLFVFLYRNNGGTLSQASWTYYSFTVEADSGYPTLEEKAQTVVNQCKVSGNAWQTALNLHDWLTHNTYYDLNYEYYGADVLFRGKGVCDSYSKAFKLLCNTAGITVERVTSSAQGHAWNVIRFGSDWYQVDVTWDDPSGGTEAVSGNEHYTYFCLSDELMFLDHTHYDVSYDPGCVSMAMNYYIKKNLWEQFGKYNYEGNTVIDYFQNLLWQGETEIEFSLSNWAYYWPGGNTGYGMRNVQYGIYVAGMNQKTWTLANGDKLLVEIELNLSDRYVLMRVLGSDIVETGTLTLPAGIKTIGEYAFEGIISTTVVIPKGCTTISAGAFRNSGVRTVHAPSTLVNIADDAFSGCQTIIFVLKENNQTLREYAEAHGHLVTGP